MARTGSHFVEGVVAAVLAGLAALLLMGKVVVAPQDRIYGLPSDPLGEVWRLAQFDRGEIGLVGNSVSQQANAPSGVPLRRPADASQILYDAPAAIGARLFGPVLAYNMLVFLAFWTTGLAAYGSMRWLGLGPVGSGLAAALFAVAPVHVLEEQLHVALAFVFMLPLLLALGIRALDCPSGRRGALFGAAVGLSGYVTGYLFLDAIVLTLGIGLAALTRFIRDAEVRKPLGRAVAAAFLAALAMVTPLLIVLALYRGSLAPELDRPLSDVATFSLQPRDYLDPAAASYIGLAGLALAAAGLTAGRLSSLTRGTLGLVFLTGFLFSLRPQFSLLGVQLPMPSKIVHSLVPYWRVFGRVEIVVALAAAFLAGFFVDRLASGRLPAQLAAVAIAVLAVADVIESPPKPAADLGRPDPLASALRHQTGAVAEYPLFGFDNYQLGPYLLRQLRHRRPLMNGSIEHTISADLAAAAASPTDPEAREALSLAGVRTLVVHPGAATPPHAGFRVQKRFRDGTTVYTVDPLKNAAIASATGAYNVEAGPDGSAFRWLGRRAELYAVADHPRKVTVSFTAVSLAVPRSVRFGRELRAVSTGPTAIELCVRTLPPGTAAVSISMEPAPQRLPGGDPRIAGIGIYHLNAELGCTRQGGHP